MLGLALEGGGSRGAFHMGAIKALLEEGYNFSGVSGTSIGAINGAILAQGDFELGYEWWKKIDNSFLFDLEESQVQKLMNKQIDKEAISYFSSKLRDIIENRGIDTKNMRETVESVIDEEKIHNSTMDFGVVTISISDFKPLELYKEDIPLGKMVDYLMASANFPVFKSEPIEGKVFLDGAFYDNCPINMLVRKGCTEIIAIRTLGMGVVRKVEDENVKITNIMPSEDLGRILNFDNDLIQTKLKMGYYDAKRTINDLKGSKYYIKPINDKLFFESLLSIPDETIYELAKILDLSQIEPKRLLFEKVFPELCSLLDLSLDATYQDIIINVLEYAAEQREIEKYKIYDLKSFIEELKQADFKEHDTELTSKNLLTALFAKKSILQKIGDEFLRALPDE
ncbi:patatin-like phospholipase family protein [Natranaerobius trueperi]|uniref:Patatin n=1 Tax=Natranaerobius trueperi TaxID=759412 RepID=A0A226BXX6_9FIRM|nr:patatin-like phospholipase family protein [Natranaerobius trueperi]OWZ83878.1 patatin [Natranaerobius trueperi]